jgi:hypothetical protein
MPEVRRFAKKQNVFVFTKASCQSCLGKNRSDGKYDEGADKPKLESFVFHKGSLFHLELRRTAGHKSSRRPLKIGWRTLPSADLARYSISANKVGSHGLRQPQT